ncbi:MAG: plasmid pRiA4b ORF-3 family protein [Mariprofundaceae bacterium]|nr:plasmid pRiA4b ORF-3 family protein [Mariprofundaceae bacterium]
MKSNTVYQIKITLNDIRPPIWRRLHVPSNCTMDALHCALQMAMGWMDGHLYAFRTKKRWVEIPDPDAMDDAGFGLSSRPKPEDSAKVQLCELAKPGETIMYDYDFGDGWVHTIRIEKAVEADDISARKAVCLKGKRACPPEDCGGPWGYQYMLETLAMPDLERDEEAQELMEWIDDDWDAEAFDLEDTNAGLSSWKPNQHSCMYEANWGEE